MRKILIILFAPLIVSCDKALDNIEDDIRQVYSLMNSFEGEPHKTKKIYDSLKQSDEKYVENKFLAEALEVAYLYNYYASYDLVVIKKLNHHKNLPEFQNFHPLNQFYNYYYLAFKYSETLDMERAVEMGSKANSVIENRFEDHSDERAKVTKVLSQAIPEVISMKEHRIRQLKEEYYGYLPKGATYNGLLLKNSYNICVNYFNLKEYKQVLIWSDKYLKHSKSLKANRFYPDLMGLRADSFVLLGKKDNAVAEYNKVKDEYENGEITESQYKLFLVYTLQTFMGIFDEDILVDHARMLETKYGDSICNNRFTQNSIYNFFLKYYREKNDLENELKYLHKNMHILTYCVSIDDFFLNEQKKTLERLIFLKEKYSLGTEYDQYYAMLKELKEKSEESKNGYMKLSNYLTDQNLVNFNRAMKSEKEIQLQQNQIKYVYFVLIFILVPALILSIYLMRKNIFISRRIEDNYLHLYRNQGEIQKKNEELDSLVKKLEESNVNLENFAFMAAKDLKSPIVGINEKIDQIKEKYSNIIETEDEEIMTFLKSSTYDLEHMIEVLLNYSKKEKNISKTEKVNLTNTLDNIQDLLSEVIYTSKAKIQYPRNFPEIQANGALIEKVFQNLIANSIKFTKKGTAPEIEISYVHKPENKIEIILRDNGIGIPKNQQNEIFKIFKKLNKSEEYEGSGIGLSTCMKIIKEFNGQIWVDSELGKGSEFHIELPLTQESLIELAD